MRLFNRKIKTCKSCEKVINSSKIAPVIELKGSGLTNKTYYCSDCRPTYDLYYYDEYYGSYRLKLLEEKGFKALPTSVRDFILRNLE